MARVNAMMLFYPGGVKQMARNYPGLSGGIDGNFDAGDVTLGQSALMMAGFILAHEVEALEPPDREAIRQQLAALDFAQFKRVLRGELKMPGELMSGTSLIALAMVMAEVELNKGEVTENQFKVFMSEVYGALEGKDSQERSAERMRDVIDETLGPPALRNGNDDTSGVLPSQRWGGDMPDLNGTECKVRLTFTATGFALVRVEDDAEITERRALTQQDLEKVKREDWDNCRFVNLRTRGGDIVSCLIVGAESEVIGDQRAFWWALAKVTVRMTEVKANGMRMSEQGLAIVHTAARSMWDAVIDRSGSIAELREEPGYMRITHFDVINKLEGEANEEAEKLGLEICRAMVLATQSEDDALEVRTSVRRLRWCHRVAADTAAAAWIGWAGPAPCG